MTAAVGGDRVEVFALAKGYQDPHFVDRQAVVRPRALARRPCRSWPGSSSRSGTSRRSSTRAATPGCSLAAAAISTPRSVARSSAGRPGAVSRDGDVHPFGNPHYWTDPENGRVIALLLSPPGSPPSTRRGPRATGGTSRRSRTGSPPRGRSGRPGSPPSPAPRWSPSTTRGSVLRSALRVDDRRTRRAEGRPPSPAHTLEIINLIKTRKVPAHPSNT